MAELEKIRVGDWAVSPAQNLIEYDGQSVKLKSRNMDVLVYLANHAGEVVSADELISAVWQGRVVGNGTVYQSINQLRHALGDSKEESRFIETIPKRGYRLTAAVAPWNSAANGKFDVVDGRHSSKWIGFAGVGILAVVLVVLMVNYVADEEQPGVLPKSVAVLPFDNLSSDADSAYFASGMHDTILNELAKLHDMNVIGRTSVLAYADGRTPIAEIAEALNVETVMEGSVQYADGRILVTAQLIDPATSVHLWSASYDREFVDIFAIQADIAANIANALEAEFSLSERNGLETIPSKSPAAIGLYLRSLTPGDRMTSIPDIDRAIALDPDFALAYVLRATKNLSRLVGLTTNTTPEEALEVERGIIDDAQRALAIDPTLAGAHAALAVVHWANWRGAEAERAFQRTVENSPNDVNLLSLYGEFKVRRGEYAQAIPLLRRAVELDPNNTYPLAELRGAYSYSGDWDAAAALAEKALSLEPELLGNVGHNVGEARFEAIRGNTDEALIRLQVAEELGTDRVYRFAQMALAYSLVGRPEDAARLFAEFEERAIREGIGNGWWAYAYVAVGDYERALQRIVSAFNERVTVDQTPLFHLATNNWRDPKLDAPEFRAFLDHLWVDE